MTRYFLYLIAFSAGALLGTLFFGYVYQMFNKERPSNTLVMMIVFGALCIAAGVACVFSFKGMVYPYIFGVTFGFGVNYKGKQTPTL